MSVEDRIRWDTIYQERAQRPYPAPDPLLLEVTPPAPALSEPARALDIACGLGQNGLWLAEQGYATDLMDVSRVALLRAQAEVNARHLRHVNLLLQDVDEVALAPESYHLICCFRFLERSLFDELKRATVVGGRIVYETFNERYADERKPFKPAYLLKIGELRTLFSDWELLLYEEHGTVTRLAALKPISAG